MTSTIKSAPSWETWEPAAKLRLLKALRAERDRRTAMRVEGSTYAGLPVALPGPQADFLASPADIVVYGGAAGGGKTYGLLLDMAAPARISNPAYGFVVFRRQSPQITNEGGLWDASQFYRACPGAYSRVGDHSWHFPSGASGRFSHLANEDDKFAWQGAEVARIGFDELAHFSEGQFFYLLSRARSTSGVRPQIRATCNPHPGWVKRFLAPWVDRAYPDRAESGTVRHFVRTDGDIQWVDAGYRVPMAQLGDTSRLSAEAIEEMRRPLSVTFIRSTVYDNPILLESNPSYLTNLMSLPAYERAQLLDGDWDVFEGSFFREWGSDLGHTIVAPHTGRLPAHWLPFGGLDGGYGAPAFVLCATDERGELHIVESFRPRDLTPADMAGHVLACLGRWGLERKCVPIAADPNMFHDNTRRDMVGEADIESFWRAGLRCFPANNAREHGWNRLREWLQRPGGLHVWLGYNSDLIELFPQMLHDPRRPNDMLKAADSDDHLHDALRYAIMQRPKPADEPALSDEVSPADGAQAYIRKLDEQRVRGKRGFLA